MDRKKYSITIFVFFIAGMLTAQINKKDSIWVADMISQSGEYEISDELLNKIRHGEFLDHIILDGKPMVASSEGLNTLHLSPADVLLYQHKSDSVFIVKSATLSEPNNVWVKEYFQIPYSQLQQKVSYAIEPGVYHGYFMNFIVPSPIATFSLEEGLEKIFSPEERHKERDRKTLNILKNYNSEDITE